MDSEPNSSEEKGGTGPDNNDETIETGTESEEETETVDQKSTNSRGNVCKVLNIFNQSKSHILLLSTIAETYTEKMNKNAETGNRDNPTNVHHNVEKKPKIRQPRITLRGNTDHGPPVLIMLDRTKPARNGGLGRVTCLG